MDTLDFKSIWHLKMLKSNRNIELSELVVYDWWRGALCLYAQENDISCIIEETYKRYGNLKNAKITLEAMIENTPKHNQNNLKYLLYRYLESDSMDSLYLDYYDNIRESDYYVDTDYINTNFKDFNEL